MKRRDRALMAAGLLSEMYPGARCLLEYGGVPWRLLIATILSAQTTDDSVNRVIPSLWEAFPDPASLAAADLGEVERIVHPLGFFRSKARSITGAASWLVENGRGEVPSTMERLLSIPGVGRKTANVVLGEVWSKPALIVDTHVKRLSARLDFSRSTDPDRIESDLARLIPPRMRTRFSHTLGFHGRRVCTARRAMCAGCRLLEICPRIGVSAGK